MSFLDELNPQQREAVETTEGPVLILAGAGSGKTRVITFRIAYLIEKMGVMPESILAVTFTNKASSEMAERVDKLVGGLSVAKPVISTFHSFCVRVLRRDIEALRIPSTVPGQPPIGLTKNFVIYDESDQQQVVKGIMRRLGLDDKQLTPRNVLSRISWAKNHMFDPQEIYLQSADPKNEKIAHIFEEYRRELLKANAMDFDDLLLEAMRLLKSVAAVREYYNRRFRYLLVDEYQDTNRPQYELMRLLAGDGHNVCAVGDEDQSIYSWRGADIRNILEFERDFPEAKIVRLEQNYRSTQNILEAASVVVANNVRRKGKNLWTSRQGGAKIGYYEAPDGENEALFAADTINRYVRAAGESGETARAAVLYRTNSQSRLFEEAMRRYQLKYHVVGGFSFYERAEIKDLISYLKVIQNPDDSVSLLRVINTPVRGIGKTTIEMIERLALETGLSMWGAVGEAINRQLAPARALAALKSFRDLVEDGRAMLAGTFVERVEEAAGLASDQSAAELRSAGQVRAPAPTQAEENDTDFDPGNFSFDFAAHDVTEPDGSDENNPPPADEVVDEAAGQALEEPVEGFRAPGAAANTAEILKFLIDRTGYIKQLEEEDTPEAFSRIENLRELVNAAMDSRDRGETLDQFLDHAALVSDADQYDEHAQITLMTLHAAKGTGVSAGGAGRNGRRPVSAFAYYARAGFDRRRKTSLLCRHDARHGYSDFVSCSVQTALWDGSARGERSLAVFGRSAATAGRRVGRLATKRAPPKRLWSGGSSRPARRPRRPQSRKARTTPTKTRTKAPPGIRRGSSRRPCPRCRVTTRSTTLPSFLRRAARNSMFRKCVLKSRPAGADSVPGRRSSTRNMGKERCISAKGMGKTPRLRYNFLASV